MPFCVHQHLAGVAFYNYFLLLADEVDDDDVNPLESNAMLTTTPVSVDGLPT